MPTRRKGREGSNEVIDTRLHGLVCLLVQVREALAHDGSASHGDEKEAIRGHCQGTRPH